MKLSTMVITVALTGLLAGCSDPEPTAAGSQAKILLAQADSIFREQDYAEARNAYEKAAASAATAGDKSVEAEALSQVARMLSLEGQMEKGRGWLQRAEGVATPDQPLGWTRYLGVRGIYERERGKTEAALATFREMYHYALEHQLPRRAMDAAHQAAIAAPLEKQVAWARLGIAAAEAAKDHARLAVLWNNLGATYEDLADYAKAVECYESARKYRIETGGDREKMVADWALGRALLRAGDLDRADGFLQSALKMARALYAKSPTLGATEWLGHTERWCGELLIARGKTEEGLTRLRAARKALLDSGLDITGPDGLQGLEKRIAEIEGGQGEDD